MTKGNGGFWNRAGRRSGGARPLEIVMPFGVTCTTCGTTTPYGLLERRLIQLDGQTVEVDCCPKGCGILWSKDTDVRAVLLGRS